LDIDRASDNELVEAARTQPAPTADRCAEALYRRFYPQVASWCLRICGNREEATDLAQEVFLRVHSRLGSFRMESRFSTWLYTVVRSVAINRGIQARRRRETLENPYQGQGPVDPTPGPTAMLERNEDVERVRQVMADELEPLEAKVLYLHHVDGLTLPAITQLLELRNRSGAKAFVVSGMRKLRRSFQVGRAVDRRTQES
jgi:RNA polymerase sigma-70 factor (ECF subfamily)